MTIALAALLLGQPPSFEGSGAFGGSVAPVEVERPAVDGKLVKDMQRLVEAMDHLDQRLQSTERVAKYAARWVAKSIDTPPTEDTGLDGWQGKPATAPRTPAATLPAAQPGMVWCVECGAYVPATHFQAARPAYQPQAYQPPARFRPIAQAVRPAPGRG